MYFSADWMGGCLSIGNHFGRGGGESSSPCGGIGSRRMRRMRGSASEQVITLQQLPSIPHRIVANGGSKTSCVFTQQGRKGINQDAMIVWEVSCVLLIEVSLCAYVTSCIICAFLFCLGFCFGGCSLLRCI